MHEWGEDDGPLVVAHAASRKYGCWFSSGTPPTTGFTPCVEPTQRRHPFAVDISGGLSMLLAVAAAMAGCGGWRRWGWGAGRHRTGGFQCLSGLVGCRRAWLEGGWPLSGI